MLNKVLLMGRLTADPDIRHTPGGTPVCSITLACERDFKAKDGSRETDFVDVVAWRNTAEFLKNYFQKGRMAVVEGRLQFRDWTDKNGQKRRNAEVLAENVYFGDSKTTATKYEPNVSEDKEFVFSEIEDEEDIPF